MTNQAHKLAELVGSQNVDKNAITKFIAITSGKGGVGKTTISANVGWLLAQKGYQVGLFDADIGLANLDVMLGVKPEKTILNLMRGECGVEDILMRLDETLYLIPGESGGDILKFGGQYALERFYEEIKKLDFLDYLVVDTGAGIGESVQTFLNAATETIIVTTPDPAAITDAYAMLKVLSASRGRLLIIINQTQSDREGELVFDKISKVASKNLPNVELRLLGVLPRDNDIAKSVRGRYLFSKAIVGGRSSSRLDEILDRLLRLMERGVLDVKEGSGFSRFFKRLLDQF
ncbi:MAG: MinD/ParA family protein [Helicobacteraceae bacterium]|jgi:flagellar biosynthesis protein FlhG|nr:MinD/ParA family protein [Helicobacteraceae bacterium]